MPRPDPSMSRAEYLQMHRERRELILADVRAGKTYAEIAAAYGISGPRVSQIATSAGIYRRKPRKAPCSTKQNELVPSCVAVTLPS